MTLFMDRRIDELLKKIVLNISNHIKKNVDEKVIDSVIQFIKFGMVGVSNTLISYIINILVLMMLSNSIIEWDYVIANIVSFVLSVLWSFYWNNRYVFKLENDTYRNVWKTLLKTYVAYGFTGIILSNILSFVWVTLLGISKFIAPLLNLVIGVPINFLINKKWAFK